MEKFVRGLPSFICANDMMLEIFFAHVDKDRGKDVSS